MEYCAALPAAPQPQAAGRTRVHPNSLCAARLGRKKKATFGLIDCLSDYLDRLLSGISPARLFSDPPLIEFRTSRTLCASCHQALQVQKTRTRKVSTLAVGQFRAREVILVCQKCGSTYRSEELCELVPSGANFGYDVLVYAGKALYLRHRNEAEVVAELAESNVPISRREVSLLGRKFIVCLAIAHDGCTEKLTQAMRLRGGYVCHLDATCEGCQPILMSSLDSLSEFVLGNVKLPSEQEQQIIPFLQHLKQTFGTPVALVHDMGRGILKAVGRVFPGVPDFICHFHFLRDIGRDFLDQPYDIIRQRLCHHQICAKLRYRAKQLKADLDSALIDALTTGLEDQPLPASSLAHLPSLNAYGLIHWALEGKTEGNGYGFPFDRPHLALAKRLRQLHTQLDKLKDLQLRGLWQDNKPYFKILLDLKNTLQDQPLWRAVEQIEAKISVFERLRQAMRIAPPSGRCGLNDEGAKANVRTIEHRVKKFRLWLTTRPDYPENQEAQKMIQQIDKYWAKLFADPITVQTPSGPIQIQPQRTNNILEQFFRKLKRGNRRQTGNGSAGRMLRTMLAQTPLVKNLQNQEYMKILLQGKESLEELFAQIEVATLRAELRKAQLNPEKIPAEIKRLITMPDYPEKLVKMVERAAARP